MLDWPDTSRRSSSRRSSPARPEQDEQIALMRLIELHAERHPVLTRVFHVPNGGRRGKAEAGIFKAMGVRAGVFDLLLLAARRDFHGLAIDMKAPGDLRNISEAQVMFARELHAEGYLVAVADRAEAAWNLLDWYVGGRPNVPLLNLMYHDDIEMVQRDRFRRMSNRCVDKMGKMP